MFQLFVLLVAILSGGIASIAGFGIGSLLTPLFSIKYGIGLAVASVSIVHFFGTLLRFIILRKNINKRILLSFGLTSVVGGLTGALLYSVLHSIILTTIFGLLLVFAGLSELTGLSEKVHLNGTLAWIAGGLSGLFGGLVGNQGGIRSAAMLGFDLNQKEFVATATGIALMVDFARVPVYFLIQSDSLYSVEKLIFIATTGVLIGTIWGGIILKNIPKKTFKKILSSIILAIGIFVLIHK